MTATPSAPPPRRGALVAFAGLLVIVALGVAAFFAARPTFTFTNRLAAPVRLVVNDAARVVPPGETVEAKVSRDRVLAQWEVVRPLSADRRPMGEEVREAWVIRSPRGTV